MNIFEKELSGKPILNTMNSSVRYDQETDPLLEKVFKAGLKGGQVSLYGRADVLYVDVPEKVKPDELVSITFVLLA